MVKKDDETPVVQNEETGVQPVMVSGFGDSFSDKVIRAKFIRKVYGLLLTQLAFTTAVISVFIFSPGVKNFYCGAVQPDENVSPRFSVKTGKLLLL